MSRPLAAITVISMAPNSTSMVAYVGHVGMNIRSEVTQSYQGVGWRRIDKGHSSSSGFIGDEDFILGHLPEANKRRAVDVQVVERAMSLSDARAVRPRLPHGAACAGGDG